MDSRTSFAFCIGRDPWIRHAVGSGPKCVRYRWGCSRTLSPLSSPRLSSHHKISIPHRHSSCLDPIPVEMTFGDSMHKTNAHIRLNFVSSFECVEIILCAVIMPARARNRFIFNEAWIKPNNILVTLCARSPQAFFKVRF